MAATKKITSSIISGDREIDLLDTDTEVCRDEACSIIEIHAAHPIETNRGAPPKGCPRCLEPIPRGQGAKCNTCGWDRRGRTFARKNVKGEQNA